MYLYVVFVHSFLLLLLINFVKSDKIEIIDLVETVDIVDKLPKISITITDGSKVLNNISLELYDRYIQDNSVIKYDMTAKLIYLTDFSHLEYILNKYQDYYNNKWIILFDNISTWRQMQNYLISKRPINLIAFIWSENLRDTDFYGPDYPVFMSDDNSFLLMTKYTIEVETGNFFINILYDNSATEYPDLYLLTLSITTGVFAVLTTLIWHYNTYKYNVSHTTALQKVLSACPYLKLILSLLIIFYVKEARDETFDNTHSLTKVYLDTIITTFESIFKTIFWFMFIMISSGWQTYRHILTQTEMRRFIGVYIFIYLSVCFDQILDLLLSHPVIFNFEISEVKNFIIFTLLACASIYKTRQSIHFIKQKYVYADILAPEFIPSLRLKLKWLKLHITVVIFHTLLYITFVVLQKSLFKRFSSPVVSMVNNNSIEVLSMMIYLIIFRSRILPPYFSMSYISQDASESGKVYTCKLPSIRKIVTGYSNTNNDFGLNKNNLKEFKKNTECPVIVINPIFFESDESNRKVNEINRSVSIDSNVNAFITDKISIGFYSKN